MKSRLIYLILILCMILSLVPVAISDIYIQAATIRHVGAGGYATIQDAINASAAGDTIIVHDGTYNENITINKSLTIISVNGNASTFIDGSAGMAVNITAGNVQFGDIGHGFGISNSSMGIVIWNEGDSAFTGIKIIGNSVYNCTTNPISIVGEPINSLGIAVINLANGSISGSNVSDNEVYNCTSTFNNPSDWDYYHDCSTYNSSLPTTGMGQFAIMFVDLGNGSMLRNDISNNHIHDCDFQGCGPGSYGIALWSGATGYPQNDSDNTISGNEIDDCIVAGGITDGVVDIGGPPPEGILSDDTISGNTIYNCSPGNISCMGGGGGGLGFQAISFMNEGIGDAWGDSISGNHVSYCDGGIGIVGLFNGSLSDTRVLGNDVHDCAGGGIELVSVGSNVYRTIISDNSVYDLPMGMAIMNFLGSPFGTGNLSDIEISENSVHNNSEGIYLDTVSNISIFGNDIRDNVGLSGINVSDSENVSAHYNNIAGNGDFGVFNDGIGGNVSATYNWWGDPSGPGPVGPGSGDAISTYVDYIPWLGAELSQPPEMFYGTVSVRNYAGGPLVAAPNGTVISAYVFHRGYVGTINVTVAGVYGDEPGGQYLIVQGNISDGSMVYFFVNGQQTPQTAVFESGAITELDLSANLYSRGGSGGGGGGGGGNGGGTPAPTPTSEATPTSTAAPTSTPTSTATPAATPQASPTPVPTPTPAGTPTPTATPSPTSTPAGALNLTIGFGGTGNMSGSGVLLQGVSAHSQDGTITVDISSGTRITDPSGQPVSGITMGQATSTPPVPDGYFLIQAFDFGPNGTTFTPAMQITLSYDLSQLPAGASPVIAYYDQAQGQWVFVTGVVDTAKGTITFPVEHFTSFAVLGHSAAPAAGGIAAWVWIVIGFVGLLALVLITWLFMRRRAG